MQEIRTIEKPYCYLCGTQGKLLYSEVVDKLFSSNGQWSFYKCTNTECDLIWLNPMPVEEDIYSAYKNYYTHSNPVENNNGLRGIYSRIQSAYLSFAYGYGNSKSILKYILYLDPDRLENTKYKVMYLKNIKGRLLDIGCGDGSFMEFMNRYGWETSGIDFDPKAINTAKLKNINVKLGTLEEQKFSDNYFDVITLSHVIEHVYDKVKLLKECYRILKPGGKVVVSTPNTQSLCHNKFKENWRGLEPPRHIHLFSPQTIVNMVKKSGFYKFKVFTNCRGVRYIYRTSSLMQQNRDPNENDILLKVMARLFSFLECALIKIRVECGEELIIIAHKCK